MDPHLYCTQAAAIVLALAGGAMDRSLLVDVLKHADALSLEVVEASNLSADVLWGPQIAQEAEIVRLVSDPGDGQLSDFEVDILTQAYQEITARRQ